LTRLSDTFTTRLASRLDTDDIQFFEEAAMIHFYVAELLAKLVLSFLLSLLQVDANIAAALLPW